MFSCFKRPSGDDMPRSKYMRSSSGGHPTSERSEWPSPRARTVSEPPPPRERKKFGSFRSAMAAAAESSKSKLKDTFQRKRHNGGARYISMQVPSDTRLPAHVPKSLGTTDNNALPSSNGEEWFQAPSSWGANRELLSSMHRAESDFTNPPHHSTSPLNLVPGPLHLSATYSISSAPSTIRPPFHPAPRSTATTSPVHGAGALQNADTSGRAVQQDRFTSCLSSTRSPPNASLKPSNPYYHAPPTTLKSPSQSMNSFISIPLDAESQPCMSAQTGETAPCDSHSNPREPTGSQDVSSHPTAAVMSTATSSSLAFRDSQPHMMRSNRPVRSGSAEKNSNMGNQGTTWGVSAPTNGAATLDLRSDALNCSAAMPEAGAKAQPDICDAPSNKASPTPSRIPSATSQSFSAPSASSSMYLAPGFAQMAGTELSGEPTQHPAVSATAQNRNPENHVRVGTPVEGSSIAAQPNAASLLPEPFTPRHTPRTGNGASRHAVPSSTPEFATPMGPSQFHSPQSGLKVEFSTPDAAVSPDRIAVLPRSLVDSMVLVQDPSLPSTAQQPSVPQSQAGPPAADASVEPQSNAQVQQTVSKGSPFHAAEVHASCQDYSAPTPSQAVPQVPSAHGAVLGVSAARASPALQHTPATVGRQSAAGLTPPQSLNLELSTPESRPMLTPDHRHTFANTAAMNAGMMGCVDNPVFSLDKSLQSEGKSASVKLTVSAARTQPGVYDQRTLHSHAQPDSQARVPDEEGTVCDSTNGRVNSAGIAAAAKRVVAMFTRDQSGDKSARQQDAQHEAAKKKKKKRRQIRQMPKDEAAELLFSTNEMDDTFSIHDDTEPVHSQEDEVEYNAMSTVPEASTSGACDTDVPSPPMPHTLSTKGTSAKPQPVRPLYRLPELSLQPSTAKKASAGAVNTVSQPSGTAQEQPSSGGNQSCAVSTHAVQTNATEREATDVSITVGLVDTAQNATESSESAAPAQGRYSGGKAGPCSMTLSSRGYTQASSRGLPGSSPDTSATVGSRVLAYEESSSAMIGNNTLASGSSVSGSGALKANPQKRLYGYPKIKAGSDNTSNKLLPDSHYYVPPDLASKQSFASRSSNSRQGNPTDESVPSGSKLNSNGSNATGSGFDHSMTVFMRPASSTSNPASKEAGAQQPEECAPSPDAGADGNVADDTPAVDLGNLHNPGSVLAEVNESHGLGDTTLGGATAGGSKHASGSSKAQPSQSGDSLASVESQYLDAVMNTTYSGLELDFSSSELGVMSPNVTRTLDHRKSKSQILSPGGSVSKPLPDANSPIQRHVHSSSSLAFAMAGEAASDHDSSKLEPRQPSGYLRSAPPTYAGSMASTPGPVHEDPEDELFQVKPRMPSPSPGHSPLPTCPSLPLVAPDAHPRVGEVLGGRFLLRRIVGMSSKAIIYSANDLQEGSVPCSVRIPAPKAPLAASMIALGRMQWLRGQLSHAEGATSLVRVLSMPNLLGHGIVVATESLEASARGRLDSISSGKSKPFSNSDLRSLARQLLKGLKFMHESGIVHGDINLDSLFFKSEEGSQIRFIDLGCGCFPTNDPKPAGHSYGKTPKSAHHASSAGSFWSASGALSHRRREMGGLDSSADQDAEDPSSLCRAPEAFATPPIVTDKMDVWAVGCILYQMETGEPLGHEPQVVDDFSPHGVSSSQYFSDTNSAWGDDTYQRTARSSLRHSLGPFAGGVQRQMSADVSEELLYDSLPGGARVRRSVSPLRQSVNTQDSAQVLRASRGSRFDADAQLAGAGVTNICSAAAAASRSAAALACAEMWDVDALVIVEDEMANVTTTDPGLADSNYAGLGTAARRDDGASRLAASAELHSSKPLHTASGEEERLGQMRACAQVLSDALEAGDKAPALSASCSDIWANENMAATWDESLSTRNKQQAHPHSTHSAVLPTISQHHAIGSAMGRYTQEACSPVGSNSGQHHAWGVRRHNAGRSRLQKDSDVRDVIRSEFKSIGNLQPPSGVTCSAPASKDVTHESYLPGRRRSLLNVWQSRTWAPSLRGSQTSRKASLSPTTVRSPTVNVEQPSRSSSPTPTEKNRLSRAVRRGSHRFGSGIRSLSSARNASPGNTSPANGSAGNSSSVPPALQSFRSDNFAAATSDSFSHVLKEFENTVDLPLTVSARESYNSLPSTHTFTKKASLQSQSGRFPGVSGALSGPLSGPLGSARAPQTPCRPWLAQRLSKIQDRDFARFLTCLLENSFMARPTADQALRHQWLSYVSMT